MHRYKLKIWNIFCFLTLASASIYLVPHIKNASCVHEEIERPLPITQKGTTRKVWKRGKLASESSIYEQQSITEIDGKKKHTIDGWTTIKWRKGDDTKS